MLYKKIQVLTVCALDNSINDGKYFNVYVYAKTMLKAHRIIIKKFKKFDIPISIIESCSKVVANNRIEYPEDICYEVKNAKQ